MQAQKQQKPVVETKGFSLGLTIPNEQLWLQVGISLLDN